jgi:hypothetical protein
MSCAFLYDDKSRAAVVTSSGTLGDGGVDRLADPQPRHRMRLSGIDANFTLDLGAVYQLDCFALISTNLVAGSTVRVRASSTDPAATGALNLDTGVLSGVTDEKWLGQVVHAIDAPIAARYVRWDLTSPSGSSIDIGLAPLGLLWRPQRNYAYGAQKGRQVYDLRDGNARTGAMFGVRSGQSRVQAFALAALDPSEVAGDVNEMDIAVGAAGDVLWVPDAANSAVLADIRGNDEFTKVLLHFDGADGSTTIADENAGGSARTWTAAGNAQIDTAFSRFGGAAGLFDGTGDYVSTPDSADLELGSQDFTLDFWFRCTAAGGSFENACGKAATGGAAREYICYRGSGNKMEFALYKAGVFSVGLASTTSFTDVLNAGWHHFAVTRSGDTVRLFVDGVLEDSDTFTGSVDSTTGGLAVGRLGDEAGNEWTGSVDEFRLSVGVARWTANFTPPAGAYALPAVHTAESFLARARDCIWGSFRQVGAPALATHESFQLLSRSYQMTERP